MSDLKGTISLKINVDNQELENLEKRFSALQSKLNNTRQATAGASLGQQAKGSSDIQKTEQLNQRDRKNLEDGLKRQNSILKETESIQKNIQSIIDKQVASADKLVQAYDRIKSASQPPQQPPQPPKPPTTPTTPAGGGPGGPGGIAGTAGTGPFGIKIPGLFKALGLTATGLKTGGEFYKQIETYPERIAQKEANIADMRSEGMRLQMQGKGYEMPLFAPERAKALERARTRVGAEKTSDIVGLGTSILSGAAGGALFGGIPGAIIGGVGGFATSMLNDRKRSMLFDRESYEKEMGSVFAGTYKEQLAAERAKSYEKDMAGQFFQQQSGRFRGLQRQFGLSDQELFLGDKQKGTNESIFGRLTGPGKRFTMDEITGAMQGISAAGGTKSMATGPGAEMAIQMQRNLNLSNAPELLGRVSGATGMGAEQSREQIFRMFAEANRIKLEHPEANKFMESATGIQYRTGGDMGTITGLMSAGVQGTGLQSARGIEAATSAFEQFRQKTGETEGLTGQYKMSSLFGKGLNLQEAAYIANLPIDQLSEDDPIVAKILKDKKNKQTGEKLTVEDLKKEMTRSTFLTEGTEKAAEKYQKSKTKLEGMKEGEEGYEKAKEEMEEARTDFGLKRNVERLLPKNKLERQALLDVEAAAMGGDEGTVKKAQEQYDKIKRQYEQPEKKMTTEALESEASDASGMLYNLKEKASELSDSFSKNSGLTAQANAAALALGHLAQILDKIKDPKAVAEIQKQYEKDKKTPVDTENKGPP